MHRTKLGLACILVVIAGGWLLAAPTLQSVDAAPAGDDPPPNHPPVAECPTEVGLSAHELRAIVREELAAALVEQALPAAADRDPDGPAEELAPADASPSLEHARARTLIDDAYERGSWRAQDREQLETLRAGMADAEWDALSDELILAVNEGVLAFAAEGPLF